MTQIGSSRRRVLIGAAAGGLALWANGLASARGFTAPTRPRLRGGPGLSVPADEADVRPALQAAIASAHAAGGGRVVLAPGLSTSNGPIHLLSGVELHLSAGARLRFAPDPAFYLPAVFTRWEGVEAYNYSPFIYARGQQDIALTGSGALDGQGQRYWLPWRAKQGPDQTRLRDLGRAGAPLDDRRFGAGAWLRPAFVQFISCQRVLIEDVRLEDSPFWCVHPVYCEDVTVRAITIVSRHVNSDGVDPDSCARVLIERCIFDVGDDGVAIKSGRDQDGWRVGRPCEDVVVRECRYIGTAGGGFAIGSEMSGGVRRVLVDGFDIPKASHAVYLKANLDRGGYIEDVHVRNVRAGDIQAFIIATNEYHSYRGGDFPPAFRRIRIDQSRCERAEIGLHITGHPRAPVREVVLDRVRVERAARPAQIADVEGLQLRRVRMNGAPLEAIAPLPRAEFLPFKR